MTCYHPLHAWAEGKNPSTGKALISFKKSKPSAEKLRLPCGQCSGCRLEYSRQWALRLIHELRFHPESCFITLTYNEDHLPKLPSGDGTLVKKDFQKFMKRLRKWENEHGLQRHIRYFHSGEYGANTNRPHYHAIIFGLDFRDKQFQFTRKTGKLAYPIYTSETLSNLWDKGFHEIGAVTFESCAYVARYVLKKRNGPQKSHYDRIDANTGEICRLQPEYSTMSRNPGIAKQWYDQYKRDVYPHGSVVHKGLELRPPRYYDTLFELEHPDLYERLKADRKAKAKESEKRGPSLESREYVHKQKLEKLVRGLQR